MDLKVYYQKIREIEAAINDILAIIVSLETPDGGKAGRLTEVSPALAAKMIVEGKAELATPEQVKLFRAQQEPAKLNRDQNAVTSSGHLLQTTDGDLAKGKSVNRFSKG